jgi:hypothetical protein
MATRNPLSCHRIQLKRAQANNKVPAQQKKGQQDSAEDAGDDDSRDSDDSQDTANTAGENTKDSSANDDKGAPTEDDEVKESDGQDEDNNSNADDANDPNTMVDIADQYVVEAIVNHTLLSNGNYKYYIAWEGYAKRTWEPGVSINNELREDYHRKDDAKSLAKTKQDAAERKARDAARVAEGGNVRSSRHRRTEQSKAARRTQVENLAHAYQADGFGYFRAWEIAEADVAP